jgi:transposase InsO family protein
MEKKDFETCKHQPRRGHRYSPAEKEQILIDAKKIGVLQASKQHGCSDWTIYLWLKKQKLEQEKANQMPVAVEKSPSNPGGLTSAERDKAILNMWKKHPGLGPSQIKNQLRREKGLFSSVNTVRHVMEENGYVLPKIRRKDHQGEYEAVRPRQLYHLDFFHFHIHKLKQCLLFILDDYSRFIPGWCLVSSERVDVVIQTFEATIARYGKPEYAMSDGGSAFHSWRGIGRFSRFLEEYGIDQWIAKDPSVNGKVEALNASFNKELVNRVEFIDRDEALRQISVWVRHYNFQRTHHALGGLLVPGDRFFGCVEESMRRIEEGNGGSPLDLLAPESRAMELFRVVSQGGIPGVYLMGRKIL